MPYPHPPQWNSPRAAAPALKPDRADVESTMAMPMENPQWNDPGSRSAIRSALNLPAARPARLPHAGVSRLLLGRLVVGVRARGVVGDVDDAGDHGNRLAQRDLDALAQGDRHHPAADAAAAQAQVG